jgi:cytochrome c553
LNLILFVSHLAFKRVCGSATVRDLHLARKIASAASSRCHDHDPENSSSAYFASLTPGKSLPTRIRICPRKAHAAAGRHRANCHSESYAATKGVARLAGRREEYLSKALHDYKSGGSMAAMADVPTP